jgi:hypothetical protein
MRKITGKGLAREIGCGPEHLQKVFKEYNDIADGKKKDPYGKKFVSRYSLLHFDCDI